MVQAALRSPQRTVHRPAGTTMSLAAAAAPHDIGTGDEIAQVAGQADARLLQGAALAGHRHHARPQTRVGGDEGALDVERRHEQIFAQGFQFGRNRHGVARRAHIGKIVLRALAGTGAMGAPFVPGEAPDRDRGRSRSSGRCKADRRRRNWADSPAHIAARARERQSRDWRRARTGAAISPRRPWRKTTATTTGRAGNSRNRPRAWSRAGEKVRRPRHCRAARPGHCRAARPGPRRRSCRAGRWSAQLSRMQSLAATNRRRRQQRRGDRPKLHLTAPEQCGGKALARSSPTAQNSTPGPKPTNPPRSMMLYFTSRGRPSLNMARMTQ